MLVAAVAHDVNGELAPGLFGFTYRVAAKPWPAATTIKTKATSTDRRKSKRTKLRSVFIKYPPIRNIRDFHARSLFSFRLSAFCFQFSRHSPSHNQNIQ